MNVMATEISVELLISTIPYNKMADLRTFEIGTTLTPRDLGPSNNVGHDNSLSKNMKFLLECSFGNIYRNNVMAVPENFVYLPFFGDN
jgi:hypothetical protein